MQKVNFKYSFFISLILLLGFLLRIHKYWEFPLAEETADEIHWTWLGSSLLAEQKPTAWSFYSEYDPEYIVQEGPLPAPIVSPSLDHPPLFSFLPGSAHLLNSPQWLDIPSRKVIRLPLVFLGLITLGLFAWWSKKILPPKWSLLATLIFAAAPSFVFSSRLAVSENLLAVWAICSAIAIYYWDNTKLNSIKKRLTIVIISLSIAAIMTKIAGVIVPVSFLFYAIIRKDKRLFLASLIGLILGVVAIFLYAASYNLELFTLIQFSQASRDIGLATLYNRLFIHQDIAKYIFFDGWIILGLISLLTWKATDLKAKSLTSLNFAALFVLINIGFIGTTVGEYTFHGWYNYSFFPFLPIFLAILFKNIYESKSFAGILAWILLLPSIKNAYVFSNSSQLLSSSTTRFWYFLGFSPLIANFFDNKKLRTAIYSVLLFLVIAAGIITILSINEEVYRPFQDNFFFRIELNNL